ncbi:MAG TPA: SDR family NAD(P)-dependent oxidoreductase [Burkholderiales bacterium]
MALNPPIEDWRGRRVWLVGASSGIGAALAEALVARGARVAVSARSADVLESRFGGRARIEPLDVTDARATAATAARLGSEWGSLDLVIHLAGTYREMRPSSMDLEAVRAIIELNLTSVFNLLAAALPQMARGAQVSIVSSVAGYGGLPNSLAYGASKAALINLAESLWLDLRARGIGVSVVTPGFVDTPLTARNSFPMPALIGAGDAAREMVRGLERGDFETHFPKRFTLAVKAIGLLPRALRLRLVRALTGR